MKRVGLVVAYDGTNYSGWQTQPNGTTIQGVLNDTLSELLGEKIETIGASRTDAGVHALGNVAVFDTESRIPGENIRIPYPEPEISGPYRAAVFLFLSLQAGCGQDEGGHFLSDRTSRFCQLLRLRSPGKNDHPDCYFHGCMERW